ncbi:MAG: PQQ-binding-like beta-propeller repeat protein [Spirochaetota bacterium]
MNVYEEIKQIIRQPKTRRRYGDVDSKKLISLLDTWNKTVPEIDTVAMREEIKKKARRHTASSPGKPWYLPGIAAAAVVVMLAGAIFLLTGPRNDIPGKSSGSAMCTFVVGEATLQRDGATRELTPGTDAHPGDIVITGQDSMVDLEIPGRFRMRIREGSRIRLSALHVKENGNLDVNGNMKNGRVLLSIKKLARGDSAYIHTPTSVAGVRGTTFSVAVDSKKNVTVKVLEGKVRLAPKTGDNKSPLHSEAVDIADGQICRVDPEKVEQIKRLISEGKPLDNHKSVFTVIPVEDAAHEAFEELSDFSDEKITATQHAAMRVLTIKADPEYSRIYINNTFRGRGRVSMTVSPGTYNVQVTAPGYRDTSFDVPVASENITREVPLKQQVVTRNSFQRWSVKTTANHFLPVPGSSDTIAISDDGTVSRISGDHVTWQKKFATRTTSTPIIAENMMIVGTADEYIHAIRLSNGSIGWSVQLEGVIYPGAVPVVVDGHVFAATTRGRVYDISMNGTKKWQIDVDGGVYSTPVKSGRMLFVVSQEGIFYGIDVTLKIIVIKKEVGRVFGAALATQNSEIVIAGYDGNVMKYNYLDDEIVWTYNTGNHILLDIISDGSSYYVCDTDGVMYKLSDSGELLWKNELGNRVEHKPVLDGNDVVVVAETVLYRLSAENGKLQWSYVLPAPASSNLAIGNQYMYIGTTQKGVLRVRK